MAPCIRTRFGPVPVELTTQFPLPFPLTRFDVHDKKGDIKKEEKCTHSLENEGNIQIKIHGNPRLADRKKERLHHHTDLNKNKHFVESNGHETIRHPKNENDASPGRLYPSSSSSLDYFARLSNPKTVPFRHRKTVPKRIHGRQLSASSELGSLSQSPTAANPKPKSHPLAITEPLLDPHIHDINHLRSLISLLYLPSPSTLICPKHTAEVSKPQYNTTFRYRHSEMSSSGIHAVFRNIKVQPLCAQDDQLSHGILQCSGLKQSYPTTSRIDGAYTQLALALRKDEKDHMTEPSKANMFPPQRKLVEMETSTGRMPWFDVPRLAEGVSLPTVDFVRGAEAVLPFLVVGIWLACVWMVIKTCLARGDKNRREVKMHRIVKAWKNNMEDGKFVDRFEKQKLLPLEDLNEEAMAESDGTSIHSHGSC